MTLSVEDTSATWQALQDNGVAGFAAQLLQRSAQEQASISERLYETSQARIAELEQQLDFWEPLGRRYLVIRRALQD